MRLLGGNSDGALVEGQSIYRSVITGVVMMVLAK